MSESDCKYTILIADDSFTNRALLAKIFSGEFIVEQAENGVQALEALRRLPDVAAVVLDIQMPELDGFDVLDAMRADESLRGIPVIVATANDEEENQLKALDRGALDVLIKPLNPQIALHRVRNIILRREADRQAARNVMLEQQLRQSEIDEKTGIYNKQAFCRKAAELIRGNPGKKYVILRWDIDRFKVFNDIFGVAAGDAYLAQVGCAYRTHRYKMLYGHWEADHFVTCMAADDFDCGKIQTELVKFVSGKHPDFEFIPRIGVYEVDDPWLEVSLMCDRALLALKSIKGDYSLRAAYYDESMRASLIEEQEIVGEMDRALEKGQFVVYLQPQYNYASNTLHGAEALVRWLHPVKGLIPPGKFIPIFEKNGFISKVDEFVWEEVCRMQRGWLDAGLTVVPVSVNVSRRDIYNPNLCETISGLVRKYQLPHRLLRLEITESAYMENPEQIIKTVEKLRAGGFAVEMDDFGSGYSSLNTLKEVPVDMLKLDMKFIESSMADSRGGSIITSVIRMAHWIKLPVIAEGVETKAQADYLKSVGCIYMQGYYYARPMPAAAYEAILREGNLDVAAAEQNFDDVQGAENFLSSSTQAALIFNSFVGGAAILEYDGSNVEALRLNEKYFEVLGTTREEYQGKQLRLQERFDPENRQKFIGAIKAAIATGDESSCELCSLPLAKNGEAVWTKARMRLLSKNISRYILYLSIEDITQRMTLLTRNTRLTERLSAIMDNVPGGIFDCEVTDRIRTVYFNDTAAAMFGYGREEYKRLFSESLNLVVHPDDLAETARLVHELIDGQVETQEVVYRHICAGGNWRWVRLTARVVERGKDVIYVSGLVMDIDAQVKNEQKTAQQATELDSQRLALQTLYDTIPCGIMQFKVDAAAGGNSGLISFNDTAWKIFGYADREQYAEAVHGHNKLKDIHPDDLEAVKKCIVKVCESNNNERVDYDHRIIRKDGSIRWIQAYFQKVGYPNGGERIQVIFSDITERKQESLLRVNSALFSLYDWVFELNAQQNTCFVRYSKHEKRDLTGKMFSFKRYYEELCGEYALPEDVAKIREFYAGMDGRDANAAATLEYRRVDPEGKIRWILSMAVRVDGATYLVCDRDVTETKNARLLSRENEALRTLVNERRKEDERNRVFIESTGAFIFDYDPADDSLKVQRRNVDDDFVDDTYENYLATLMDNPNVSAADRAKLRDVFAEATAAPIRRTLEYGTDRFGGGFVPCRAQLVSVADESGKVYRIIGQVNEIQDEKNRQLSEKLAAITGRDYKELPYYQPLVDDVLRALESASDTDSAVRTALAAVGRRFNVSRVYIIEEDGDSEHCSNTFEWCGEGVAPAKDSLQHYRYPDGMREKYIAMFDEEGVFTCSDTASLTGWIREVLEPQGIKSIVQCAIMEAGVFRGYVGFDECRETRNWTELQKNTLRVVSHVVGLFLFANRDERYMELPADTQRAMDESPAYIYVIDPDTCRILYRNKAVGAARGTVEPGEICYKAFANRETLCETCPFRKLTVTGVPTPVRVLDGGINYIMQAAPFIWRGRKAVILSGTDESCFAAAPDAIRRLKYERDIHRYAHTLSGLYDEIFELNYADNVFMPLFTKLGYPLTGGKAAALDAVIAAWSARFVYDEDRTAFAEFVDITRIRESFRKERPHTVTFRVSAPDGTLRYYQGTLLQLDAQRYLCCGKDVTKQKRDEHVKEEMLVLKTQAEAQDRYRVVVEQTGTAVFEMNYVTGKFYSSEAYNKYEISRYDHETVLANAGNRGLVHRDDQPLLEKFFADCASGAPYTETILRVRMTDGGFRWTRMAGTFIRDEKERLLRVIGTFTDLDDEMRAKTELAEISDRLRQIIANIPSGVAIYEIDGEKVSPIYASDKVCKMFGLTREECSLRIANGDSIGFLPDIGSLSRETVAKMLSGEPFIQKLPARTKDGVFWLRASYSMNKKQDGKTLCYAVLADVSEEMKNERQYMWQAEMYKILSESAGVITFDYSPQEDMMRVALMVPEKGYTENVRERYLERFADYGRIPREDKKDFVAVLKMASSAATHGTYDFRGDYYGAGMRWYRAKYASLEDEEGRVYRVIGILDDISDIKRADTERLPSQGGKK